MSKPIKKAYKFRFYPQEELKVLLAKTFGCVRFVYNQTLDFSEKHYAQKDKVENYKSLIGTDRVLTKANRFYPSSKTCSCCGHIYHGLKLSERRWTCSSCNAQHDRDENACLNLFNYQQSAVGTTVNARRGNVRPKKIKKIPSKSL